MKTLSCCWIWITICHPFLNFAVKLESSVSWGVTSEVPVIDSFNVEVPLIFISIVHIPRLRVKHTSDVVLRVELLFADIVNLYVSRVFFWTLFVSLLIVQSIQSSILVLWLHCFINTNHILRQFKVKHREILSPSFIPNSLMPYFYLAITFRDLIFIKESNFSNGAFLVLKNA